MVAPTRRQSIKMHSTSLYFRERTLIMCLSLTQIRTPCMIPRLTTCSMPHKMDQRRLLNINMEQPLWICFLPGWERRTRRIIPKAMMLSWKVSRYPQTVWLKQEKTLKTSPRLSPISVSPRIMERYRALIRQKKLLLTEITSRWRQNWSKINSSHIKRRSHWQNKRMLSLIFNWKRRCRSG